MAETTESSSESTRWIVGVDGSESARHAARWAAKHISGRADELQLLSAWQIPPAPALPPIGPLADNWEIAQFERIAENYVTEIHSELDSVTDVAITTAVVRGQAAASLLAAGKHAAMVVVGCRGLGGFARLVLGSTSTQCGTHAVTPTAVIHHDAQIDSARQILVAVDMSETSLRAARWAIEFAAPGSIVDLVYVWDVMPIAVGSDQFVFPGASDLARERFDHHYERLIDHASDDTARNITIRHRFEEGSARHVLDEAAQESDLVVMGARGHGAIGSAILGSVSTWLLHHVTTPMVIIPSTVCQPDATTDDAQR